MRQLLFRRFCDDTLRHGWVDGTVPMRLGKFVKFKGDAGGKKDAWWQVVSMYPPQPHVDNGNPVYNVNGYWLSVKGNPV